MWRVKAIQFGAMPRRFATSQIAALMRWRGNCAMRECRCPACSVDPLPTYTEVYRHQCEIEYVLSLPDKPARRRYLAMVGAKRSAEASRRLSDGVVAAWRDNKDGARSG